MKHTKKILAGAISLALFASAQAAAVNYIGITTDTDVTTVIDLGNRTVRSNLNTTTLVYPSDAAFAAALGGTFVSATGSSPATWTWLASETNILQELVFITNGDLVIEAGSIVRGQPDGGTFNPGALAISRGAKIIAQGNSGAPIVFTGAGTGAAGTVRASGLSPAFWDSAPLTAPKAPTDAGKWGGLLVMGNALTNSDRNPATAAQEMFDIDGLNAVATDDRFSIEGIPASSTAFIGGYDRFGGFAANDNSGVMTYLSIRHGGANLAANNEINGLTLGAVGRGTTVSYIEIWGNTDDGIEIFGGSVNLDHVAVFAQQDDGLDLDVGYTGTIQFALVVNSTASDKVGEWDGSYQQETSINGVTYAASGPVAGTFLPTAQFTVANATFIGNSGNTSATISGLHIRDQAAPRFINSIVVNLGIVGTSGPVEVDNRGTGAQATTNLFDKEIAYLKGITFWKTGNTGVLNYTADVNGYVQNGSLSNTIARAKIGAAKFENTFNVDPGLVNVPVGALPSGLLLNPVPASAIGAAFDELVAAGQSSYAVVSYRGAFENDQPVLWTADWTAADAYDLIVK
jgi:hypothetical protein